MSRGCRGLSRERAAVAPCFASKPTTACCSRSSTIQQRLAAGPGRRVSIVSSLCRQPLLVREDVVCSLS